MQFSSRHPEGRPTDAESAVICSAQKTQFVKILCDSIIEAVRASGTQGAPAGHLYAAMMAYGFSLEQFEKIMGALVRVGELQQRGNLYFAKAGAQ